MTGYDSCSALNFWNFAGKLLVADSSAKYLPISFDIRTGSSVTASSIVRVNPEVLLFPLSALTFHQSSVTGVSGLILSRKSDQLCFLAS